MKKLIKKITINLLLSILMGSMIIGSIVLINMLVEYLATITNVYILTFLVLPALLMFSLIID